MPPLPSPADQPQHPIEPQEQSRRALIRFVRMAFFVLITTVALVTIIQRQTEQTEQAGFSAPLPHTTAAAERATTPSIDHPDHITPTPLIPDQPDHAAIPTDQPTPAPAATTPSKPSIPRPPPPAVSPPKIEISWWVPIAISLALFAVVLLVDVATPNKKISSISAVLFGLLAGILATVAISAVMELALRVWLSPAAYDALTPLNDLFKSLLGIALCYLGITTILQTQDDFRLVIPYVEFAKQIRGTKPLILDTSALIDARIVDIAGSGILQAPLIIPRFVIAELQMLSDSADKLKRARGRRGLDVVTRMQRQGTLDVSIDDTPVASMAVDQALVELAHRLTARLVTTDLGLTRVAQIHGVVVLNIHEIAAAFRPALIPGQTLALRLIKVGEQANQGVGYLDEGTMVVAEGAGSMVGQEVQVVVTSTIQTSGGRMVFARPIEVPDAGDPPPPPSGHTPEPEAPEPDHQSLTEPVPDTATPPLAFPASGLPRTPGTPVAAAGPYPPKPPARRPPGPRNPRR